MVDKLHNLFESQLCARECFGGAAAVIKGGEVVFCESFGDERFNEKSLYRLASVTKIITAAAILRLHEDGRLNVYDKVSKYLPQFAYLSLGAVSPNGNVYSVGLPKREITLFDLLTHSAGLGCDELGNREYAVMPTDEKVSLERVTAYYGKNFHLAFEPSSRFAYSGFAGFDVLARISEIVCGMRFNDIVQTLVCKPLSMTDTTFQPSEEQYARIVPMHQRISGEDREVNFRGNLYRGMPRTYEAAGASLVSSINDMIKFCKALLYGGLLKEETLSLMFAPALPDGIDGLSRGENTGLGCFVISGQHRLLKGTVYSHGAYGTHLLLDKSRDIAAIFLKNSFFDMSTTSHATVEFENAVMK